MMIQMMSTATGEGCLGSGERGVHGIIITQRSTVYASIRNRGSRTLCRINVDPPSKGSFAIEL